MPACTNTPADKRRQARLVGSNLVKKYGKKRYYTLLEVRNANRQVGVQPDYVCWSYAIFTSHEDFNEYHRKLGETCDYAAMKTDMLSSLGNSFDPSSLDIDASWLEMPSIDLSSFDGFALS